MSLNRAVRGVLAGPECPWGLRVSWSYLGPLMVSWWSPGHIIFGFSTVGAVFSRSPGYCDGEHPSQIGLSANIRLLLLSTPKT